MKTRRTLANAVTMSPDAEAFIRGAPTRSEDVAPIKSTAGTTCVESLQPPAETQGAGDTSPVTATSLRSSRRRRAEAPQPEPAFYGDLLVPLTTRIRPATANALRRAHLEQRLRHARPATQQEIVEDALDAWLARHGFLERR